MADARRRAIQEQVREVLDTPAFHAAVARLRHELVDPVDSFGYDRPTTSSLQSIADRQPIPALPGSEDLLVSENKFVVPHVAAAKQLESPFSAIGGTRKARPDLRAAVRYVAGFKDDPTALRADRQRKARIFGEIRASLAHEDAALRGMQTPEARGVQSAGASIATLAAACRAAGMPDDDFAACQVHGFPCVGDVPDSGVFRANEKAASVDIHSLHHPAHNEAVASRLRREHGAARRPGGGKKLYQLEVLTRKTRKEVDAGHAFGPFTAEELDSKFGVGRWRCMQRFGVEQGFEADGVTVRIRPCDNGRASQHNAGTTVHETIACEDATFPVLVASLFAEEFGDDDLRQMGHATDDVDSAYRRMASDRPEMTVIAIFDVTVGGVRYYTMNGFNFGILSAVLAFNRHSQRVAMIARRFFGVCTAAYFDDYDTAEPTYAGRTAKEVLHRIHGLLGMPLAKGDKDVPFRGQNAFLGVVSDLTAFCQGLASMRSKPVRVAKVVASLEEYMARRTLSGDPLSLFGKLEYIAGSAGYSRVGRAALSTLRAWHADARASQAQEGVLPTAVLEALHFFHGALPELPARRFKFGAKRERKLPIVAYTDAMYEGGDGCIGIAKFDPEMVGSAAAPDGWLHASARPPSHFLDGLIPRKQQIGPLETVAPICMLLSRPEDFRDREVILFVDNTQAVYTLAGGYARASDCAHLVHLYQCLCAALGTQVWIEYVPSGANIADHPSRGDMSLLEEWGSVDFSEDIEWPDLRMSWLDAFRYSIRNFAPKPPRSEFAARKRVREAIDEEISKRARAGAHGRHTAPLPRP